MTSTAPRTRMRSEPRCPNSGIVNAKGVGNAYTLSQGQNSDLVGNCYDDRNGWKWQSLGSRHDDRDNWKQLARKVSHRFQL